MVFWSAEQPIPEQKPPESFHDFDDILATRTPTSWDQDENVFEDGNDVSPDSSVGEPEKVKEDIEMYIEEPKKPVTSSFSFFPWPFNSLDDEAETRQVNDTATNEAPDVPFDERIPPSDGSEVPFDECRLTVESAQSTDISYLTVEKVSQVESGTQPVQKESSPLPVNGNNDSSETGQENDGCSDEEIEVSATVSTQRPQVGLSSPISRDTSSIDELVNNLEAVARRIDALSDEIAECRTMDSTSIMMQKSTRVDFSESLVMGKLSVDEEFKVNDIEAADAVEQCRSEEVEPLASVLSDGIEECRTMDSTGSKVKRASSIEYTESLIRKLSTDKDCMDIPDDEVDDSALSGILMIGDAKIFHPPSSSRKKTRIKKDIDDLDDHLFDEIHQIRSIDTINSILEEVGKPVDSIAPTAVINELETIYQEPPKRSLLKKGVVPSTSCRDKMSLSSSSKKVRFAEEIYETCPSSTSDLDFDYMKHAFDGEDGKDMYDEASVDEESNEDSLFEESDHSGEKSSPWFSFLLQAK